jgi:hypothetical protein
MRDTGKILPDRGGEQAAGCLEDVAATHIDDLRHARRADQRPKFVRGHGKMRKHVPPPSAEETVLGPAALAEAGRPSLAPQAHVTGRFVTLQ